MSLRPYKFVVQAVVQQVDPDGTVTGEVATDQAIIFGCDMLAAWAEAFTGKLAEAESQKS